MTKTNFEIVLGSLESVTAKAVQITDPSLNEVVDTIEALDLVEERGTLLRGLKEVLSQVPQLTYIEWNRLVIVQFQGTRIEANLNLVRSTLAAQLSGNAQDRALLARMTGAVGACKVPSQIGVDLAACVL